MLMGKCGKLGPDASTHLNPVLCASVVVAVLVVQRVAHLTTHLKATSPK
jgi:hypothetical protein